MAYSDERTIQLVKLPEPAQIAIEKLAEQENKNIASIYDDAIDWFIKNRRKQNEPFMYFAPRNNAKEVSMWLKDSILERARTLAAKDEQKVKSLHLTAVILYLRANDKL